MGTVNTRHNEITFSLHYEEMYDIFQQKMHGLILPLCTLM